MEKITTKRKQKDIDFNSKKTINIISENTQKFKQETSQNEHNKSTTQKPKKRKNKSTNQKTQKINNLLKNSKKTQKNCKKSPKNSIFYQKIKQNSKILITLCALLFLTIALVFVTFLHSEFYAFLNRPKLLESPKLTIFFLLFLALAIPLYFVLKLLYLSKVQTQNIATQNIAIQNKNSDKTIDNLAIQNQNSDKIKDNSKEIVFQNYKDNSKESNFQNYNELNSIVKTKDNSKESDFCDCNKSKNILKTKKQNKFFKNFYVIFSILVLLIPFFFLIKSLILCVAISFFATFFSFALVSKSKKSIYLLFLSIAMSIVAVCNFLSFYLIYMLK